MFASLCSRRFVLNCPFSKSSGEYFSCSSLFCLCTTHRNLSRPPLFPNSMFTWPVTAAALRIEATLRLSGSGGRRLSDMQTRRLSMIDCCRWNRIQMRVARFGIQSMLFSSKFSRQELFRFFNSWSCPGRVVVLRRRCVTSLHLKGSCGACGMSMLKIAHVEDGVASAGHELLVGGGWCD